MSESFDQKVELDIDKAEAAVDKRVEKIAAASDEVWLTNRKRVILFLLVLLSSLSLPYFRSLNDALPKTHPAIVAILSGLIVTALTYFPAVYVDKRYAISHAVLLGLLVAEFTVYGSPIGFPTPVVMSFFFFMFYVGESEADALWPPYYDDLERP